MWRWFAGMGGLAVLAVAVSLSSLSFSRSTVQDGELKGSFRQPQENGWTYVHLQGTPHQIGFQNGYLLAPEIEDYLKVMMLEQTHDNKKDWAFFRDAAQNMMWPHIEAEYREELQGIADGANAHGVKLDVWDMVGHQRRHGVGLLRQGVRQAARHQDPASVGRARALQRLRRDRQLHQRRQGRDRAQQLVDLYGWRALDHHLRHRSRQGLSHADGRPARASSTAATIS